MFNRKTLTVLLLVLFVVSLTASAASAGKVVSLPALQQAAKLDPARPQGGTTPGAVDSVKIVEAALVKAGYLADNSYAKDGSYGTATIKAYQKWQRYLGSAEKYCDGIPGKKDLTKLGDKYGFTVDTSIKTDTEKKLNVPLYLQKDSQWSAEKLGYSQKGNTIGSAGCAITSISMVFKYYGVQTDPKNLNTWLKQNNGYNGGDVIWENAPGISKGKVKFISRIDYKRIPADLNKINTEINNGHPVIAQVKPDSDPHFVVITGYSGSTYYINDPIYGKSKLSDHYNKDPAKAIYGIRIYH